MGKKFLKSISDFAARPRGKKGAGSEPGFTPDEERAAFPGAPEFDPLDAELALTDAELQEDLAASDEEATAYVKPAIEVDEVSPVGEGDLLKLIADQYGLEVLNLDREETPPSDVIKLLSPDEAKMLNAVPVKRTEDDAVVVAISDPSDPTISDDIARIIESEVVIVVAAEGEIKERIEEYYGLGEETLEDIVAQEDIVEEKDSGAGQNIVQIEVRDQEALHDAPPVIKLVNLILAKAIKERASDIHIEPFPNLVRLRYRVDGILREIPSPPRHMLMGIVSRIKVMADMDIAETRRPLDGRVRISLDGHEVDLRVSSIPTVHGEAIVMRVLDKSMMMIGISQIGMSDDMLGRFLKHVSKPNGIVLVTGPTGCGKTTTLYAAINEVKDPGAKLITVEDPVEFEVPGIVQVNINEGVGLTFGKCLRAILRQDPDTVLVGEIRDVETAQISIQASLTGHLVFSTLHTNSAAATMTRLIDMGIPPFMITSSVEAIIGQRLVRTICSNCRTAYTPIEEEIEEFRIDADDLKDHTFFQGEGCNECEHFGYRGRMGLFELLELTEEMRELILDQGTTDEIQELASRDGMSTMRQDGWLKICLGLTSFEEVARETPGDLSEDGGPSGSDSDSEETSDEAPKAEEIAADEKPAIEGEVKALPQVDEKTGAIEGEAGARIFETGDAKKTSSSS